MRTEKTNLKNWHYHILAWTLVAAGIYFIYPFKEHVVLNKNVILPLINIQWLCYILVSGYSMKINFKTLVGKNQKLSLFDKWLFLLLLATLILWTVYFFTSYDYFIAGSIAFSVLFYGFFLFFIFSKKMAAAIFKNEKKHAAIQLENQDVKILIEKLNTLMVERKLFKNPTLKSSDVAHELGITVHQFSQFLNEYLGKNFSIFINEYRVEEAKNLLFKNTKYTLEAVGNQAGFNSKTTFFTTFKKLVGTTPSKYQSQF